MDVYLMVDKHKHKSRTEGRSSEKAERRGMSGLTKGIIAAAVIVGLVVFVSFGATSNWWQASTPGATPITPVVPAKTTAGFSLTVKDGLTGAARNLTAWDLHNTTDITDGGAYESTKTGYNQVELTRAVLDQTIIDAGPAVDPEVGLYLYATAANNESAVHNWCAYAPRWIHLNPYGANVVDFYAAPTNNIGRLFQQDGTAITLANFTNAATYGAHNDAYPVGNFSALIGINASDIGFCGYHGQFDPDVAEGPDNTAVYLTFNFNNSAVVDPDLIIANVVGGTAIWEQVSTLNETCIAFRTSNLYDTSLLNFKWKAGVSLLLRVDDVELQMGTQEQISAHTGTVLRVII